MYYVVYKVTNKINGKIYIGTHKTKNLDDEYMGSGKYLERAKEKYGIINFKKEILHIFDNPKQMFEKEAEIVNEDFISKKHTYNIKCGGYGGFDYINGSGKNLYGLNGKLPNVKNDLKRGIETQKYLREHNEEWKNSISKKISESLTGRPGSFTGKTHTENTKRIIGTKNSKNQSGQKNSQYGTRWIHSLKHQKSKKIKKDEILPHGWKEGRKMNFD